MDVPSVTFRQALKWSYALSWGEQALTMLVTLILAAHLGPSVFGLMAMALAYVMFIQMVLDQGLGVAVVQKPKLESAHLDSVFWLVVAASIVLMGVSIALSGWWAHLTRQPELSSLIGVLSLTLPVRGLTVVQAALLQRHLQFKKLAIRTNVAVLVGGSVGIAAAFGGQGVWALAWQRLAADVTGLILLWRLGRWRPGFNVNLASFRELLSFSGATFLGSLGVWVQTHADAFLMGALLGPLAVGIYRFSFRLVHAVVNLTTSPLRAVSLPHLSKLQADAPAFSAAVLEALRLSVLCTIPLLAVLAVSADSIVRAMGPEWEPATNVIRILSVFGATMALAYFSGPILTALGRPHLLAASMWIHGALWCTALGGVGLAVVGSGTETQVTSVALARVAIAFLVSLPIVVLVLTRMCDVSHAALIRTVAPSVLTAMAVTATARVGWAIHLRVPGLNAAVSELLGDIVVGLATAIVVLALADRKVRSTLERLLASRPGGAWGPTAVPLRVQEEPGEAAARRR